MNLCLLAVIIVHSGSWVVGVNRLHTMNNDLVVPFILHYNIIATIVLYSFLFIIISLCSGEKTIYNNIII
jgi:hypothetical protein